MDQQKTSRIVTRLGPLQVHSIGAGPSAVLWHSLFVDSTTWTRLLPTFTAQRQIILIDGPGHGDNPRIADNFTLEDCAGAALEILDHLGIDEPVDWVGNAWGGHVGITFAATYPDRCRSLVTIGTPVQALARAERQRIMLLRSLYRVAGPGPFTNVIRDALLGAGAGTGDPEAAGLVTRAFRRANRRGMFVAIGSISLDRPDLTTTLAAVKAPTMLVAGDDDPMGKPDDSRAAIAAAHHGDVVTVAGAGHVAPLLNAAPAVAEIVTAFWRDLVATTDAAE